MNAGEFEGVQPDHHDLQLQYRQESSLQGRGGFATWLMMAKLGGFDDLPSNAQSFLTNYRTRLDMMSEAESTALAVREVYNAYYREMGGVGAAPEPKARTPATGGQGRAVSETASTSARRTQFDLGPKIAPRLADFREHGGCDCAYRFLTQ
jgi:hypothetical protein